MLAVPLYRWMARFIMCRFRSRKVSISGEVADREAD
jgi:hypothetical protein